MNPSERSTGRVTEWHEDEAWGVIASAATPGGCWFLFDNLRDGLHSRDVRPGLECDFSYESAKQDGYDYRARAVVPPGGDLDAPWEAETGGTGFHSVLRLEFDSPPDDPEPARDS